MSYLGELRKLVGHRPLLSAGATVIVMEKDEILLNLRSDTNTWGIPGGAMELGETLEQAAHRELLEETGLSAETMKLVTVLSGQDYYFEYPNGDKLYSVIALFRAENVSGDLHISDGESLELRFFKLRNLPRLESRAAAIIEWMQENKAFCECRRLETCQRPTIRS